MPQNTCPKCGERLTRADRVCPYCEFELAPPPPPIDHPTAGKIVGSNLPQLVPDSHTTTFILMVMCVGLFAASMLRNGAESLGMSFTGRVLVDMGAIHYNMYYTGEWWRLITAGFLHGGLMHIGLNMMGLYQLGNEVEEFFGTPRYLVIYIVSTISGFYLSWLSNRSNPFFLSVGASAAIFGLLGAQVAYAVLRRSYADKQYYIRLAVYAFVLSALMSFARVFGRTDNAAHLGGLLGGFAIAWLAGLPRVVPNWRERFWQAICWACIGLVVLSYVTWARRYVL